MQVPARLGGDGSQACNSLSKHRCSPLTEGHGAVLAPAGNAVAARKGLPVLDRIPLLQQVLLCGKVLKEPQIEGRTQMKWENALIASDVDGNVTVAAPPPQPSAEGGPSEPQQGSSSLSASKPCCQEG